MKPVKQFKPDKATQVYSWDLQFQNADPVLIELNGSHGPFINYKSDKNYIIVDGNVSFEINDETTTFRAPAFLKVAKSQKHKLIGENAKFICISEPPFDPDSEEVL
jgi:mannose-6-phosphate isomerase-like protein (cupin superfamily)